MSFGTAIATVFRKYAEFAGLATRPEFWWWSLFNALVLGALNLFTTVPFGSDGTVGGTLAGLWALAVLLPSLAVTVRRLRDAGYGWGNLFWLLLPVVGWIIVLVFCAQPARRG